MPRLNPPAPLINGDVFRFTMQIRAENQITETTHDYMSTVFAVDPAVAMAALQGQWLANVAIPYQAVTANDGLFYGCIMQCLSSQFPPSLVSPLAANGTGGVNHLPLESSAVVSRYTALKGQHGRGRFYPSCLPVAFSNAGAAAASELTNAAVGLYQALGTALLLPVVAAGVTLNPVIASRPTAPSVLVTRAQLVTSYLCQVDLGSIRRRKLGRGI
jgi:hypothetical protein